MKAIVTVRLPRNPKHNPRNKQAGTCPLVSVGNFRCTDVTGSHHSYLETGIDLEEIERKARAKYNHITRIEVI